MKPLPDSLAGYQQLSSHVEMKYADLVVIGQKSIYGDEWCRWFKDDEGVKRSVSHFEAIGRRVYRLMPCPKQGDTALPEILRAYRDPLPPKPAKALTFDDGKAPLASLPPAGLTAVARVQAHGKRKYGDDQNYRKGMEATRQMSCALRHIYAWLDGETLDKESGESHLAHATARLLFCLQNQADGTLIDDRHKRANPFRPFTSDELAEIMRNP